MPTSELLPVQFHSDTIFCVNVNDQPFAPVKPIVENMGLIGVGSLQNCATIRRDGV